MLAKKVYNVSFSPVWPKLSLDITLFSFSQLCCVFCNATFLSSLRPSLCHISLFLCLTISLISVLLRSMLVYFSPLLGRRSKWSAVSVVSSLLLAALQIAFYKWSQVNISFPCWQANLFWRLRWLFSLELWHFSSPNHFHHQLIDWNWKIDTKDFWFCSCNNEKVRFS